MPRTRTRFLPSLGGRRVVASSMSGGSEQKALLERYFADLSLASGDWEAKPWPIERAVREGYLRVVWVFRSVEAIAGNSSRLPFRVREGETVLHDHPTYRVLNKQANPIETGRSFRKRLSGQVLLSPRGAFVEVTESRAGDLLRADLLPPGRTVPVPGSGVGDDIIRAFRVDPVRFGDRPRFVEPERVRWVREASPIDPFGAVTPLEAAGLSVELDHFARLYNASFMRRDGRPGGILGVKGDVEDAEMDRIEARFGGGPTEAGRLSVIAGDLDYVDTAKTPRDAQYVQSSNISKTEILVAFGVPESIIGNASGRTFANAEAEEYAFWTTTMQAHNDLIVAAFDIDSEDGLDGFLDTSKVEVLQRPALAAREEARKEVEMGLRSPYSYAQLAGNDEVESTPQTRALYIPSGSIPVAATEADVAALAALAAPAAGEAAPPPDTPVADLGDGPGFTLPPTRTDPGPPPPPGADGGGVRFLPSAGPRAPSGSGDSALPGVPETTEEKQHAVVPSFRVVVPQQGETSEQAVTRYIRQRKAAMLGETEDGPLSAVDPKWRAKAEADVARLLEQVAVRMSGVVQARLRSQKARKGTRHWQPDPTLPEDTRVGEKALDSARIVDVVQWQEETRAALEEPLRDLVQESAALLIRDLDLASESDVKGLTRRLLALIPGMSIPLLFEVVGIVLRMVDESIRRQADSLADLIDDREGLGDNLDEIVDVVKTHTDKMLDWARGLAVQVATATIEGGRDAIVRHYADPDIVRRWRSQRDDKVRATHVKADGQEQYLGDPFEVGNSLLRFPGDPLAPFEETANCRCFLIYRSKSTGQFRRRPAGERDRKHLPGQHDQGSHGNAFRAKPGATPLPSGRLRKADREQIRVGRARLYGVTPPPLRGRGAVADESEVVDSAEEAEKRKTFEALLEDWTDMPPGVTDDDLATWRADWEEEFDEQTSDEDGVDYAALDDAFLANWAQEWATRPWKADDDDAVVLAAARERLAAAQAARAEQGRLSAEDENAAAWERDAAVAPVTPARKRSAEKDIREQYDLYVEAAAAQAEADTRGNMMTAAGQAAGISTDYLFRGRLPRKYASEELLRWWQDNPRMTWTQFRFQALGRDSDRRRVTASQGHSNGQDFG